MDRDTPLLTFAQLETWESRVVEIDESIRAQTEEKVALLRKIEAAKVFTEFLVPSNEFPNEPETDIASSPEMPPTGSEDEESAAHEILMAVGLMKTPQKPVAIRQWINKNNPELSARLKAHPQYLYTVLARHVRAGRLAKRGARYRVPTVSPKGGTGGVATSSGGLNGSTPFDARAVEAAAEAGGT